jgi:catecholate siderophore receptor
MTGGYERFEDERTADRGIPSFAGRPIDTPASTFFGDPAASVATVTVDAWSAVIEHRSHGGVVVRNRFRYAVYDKFYQNVYPGAVDPTGTRVSISAYNNGTDRDNVFDQTDVIVPFGTGTLRHTLLVGGEWGRQQTANVRNTGYFGPSARTSLEGRGAAPRVAAPVVFRPSANDPDTDGTASVAAAYLQDQLSITPRLEATIGLRLERLLVRVLNNRTSMALHSEDRLLAPRLGLVYKAGAAGAFYASYGTSYQPRAGEQLASLTLTNQALEPERFTNYEIGTKWDVARVSATAAVYRLDRANVAVPDPSTPTQSVLVRGQRSSGVEISLSGAPVRWWQLMAAYAHQRGRITSSLSPSALAGAALAQLPAHSLSVWNRFDVTRRVGVAAGVVRRSDMFAATDNVVVLPGYTRVDGAVYVAVSRHLRAQVNLENVLNRRYYASAHNNNNISPGAPRAARLVLTTTF